MRVGGLTGAATLAALLAAYSPGSAPAQTVEENAAPIVQGDQLRGLPAPASNAVTDDTPFGVDLARIRIVTDPNAAAGPNAPEAIDLSGAGPLLNDEALRRRLNSYLGAPMTRRMIAAIQADVTAFLRDRNRPLVSVAPPPQEISDGSLTLLVTLFQLGDVKTEGNAWSPDAHLTGAIRAPAGEPVDSAQLIEDVNWLNLNPYRNLGVVFEPGTQPGETNLILRSNEEAPYTVFAGYANSGAREDDQHRIFVGATVGNFPLIDAQLSYQFTTSPETVERGRIASAGDQQGFLTHALSMFAPLQWENGSRGKLSLAASYVSSFSNLAAPFTQDNEAFLLSGEYAVPLAPLGSFRADVYGAAEYKRQENDVFFAGAQVNATEIEVMQGVFGLRGGFATGLSLMGDGRASFDASLVISPGGLSKANDDAAFAAASGDPNADAHYGIGRGSFSHLAPITEDVSHRFRAAFQIAQTNLPGIEEFAHGGASSVRGYLTNEASGDDGFTIRNEIVGPAISLFGGDGGVRDMAQPFGFVDYGWSKDQFANTSEELTAVGVGVNIAINDIVSGSLIYGHALTDGPETEAGDHRLFMRLSGRF